MKNNKGITLIALVVTIIVLLILAGVSIAMLTGQNGILTNAQKAKNESGAGTLDEAAKIAIGNIMTDEANLGWPYGTKNDSDQWVMAGTDASATIATAKSTIVTEIGKVNSKIVMAADPWKAVTGSTTKFELTATVDDKTQTVTIDLATGAVTK